MQQLEQMYQRRRRDTSRWHLVLYLTLSLSSFQPPSYVIATIVLPNSFLSTLVSKQLISNKQLLHGRFCAYDPSCIDAVPRGGGDGSYNDTTSDDEDSTNKESNDIPIDAAKELSLETPTTTISSSSSTAETTATLTEVEGTSNSVFTVPPPPPPATSIATMDATPSPTDTTSTTAGANTAINDIRTAFVTTASMVQNSLNNGRQQMVQTIRTTYSNVQPYIPINEKYIMTSQHQIMIVSILLVMNSGYLNGLGLFGLATAVIKATSSSSATSPLTSTVPTSQAVAAVTSAFTNVGLQLGRGNIYAATIPLRLIFSYLMGSFVTGYLVYHTPTVPYEITTYPVSIIFAIGTIALMMVSSILSSNTMTMNIFYLLTFVNGLQNGFTSIYSSNQIRSAHYSGMTSDTGTFLGQYIRSYINHQNSSNERKKDLLPKIYRNTILSTSFIVGGILSYWISQHCGSSNANYVMLPSILLYMTFTIVSLLWKPTTTTTASQTSPALQ